MGNIVSFLVNYEDEDGDIYVYRLLRPSEDPSKGLEARDPSATTVTVASHIHGKKLSPFISTTATKSAVEMFVSLAERKGFQVGFVVKINISKLKRILGVEVDIVDLSKPDVRDKHFKPADRKGRNYASKYQEVLIRGRVPTECVTLVEDCEDSKEFDIEDYSSTTEEAEGEDDYEAKRRKVNDEYITIFVKGIDGKTTTLRVRRNYTVAEVKAMLEDRVGIPASAQRLIYGPKELVDNRTLEDYAVQPNSTLHLTLRLKGGFIH